MHVPVIFNESSCLMATLCTRIKRDCLERQLINSESRLKHRDCNSLFAAISLASLTNEKRGGGYLYNYLKSRKLGSYLKFSTKSFHVKYDRDVLSKTGFSFCSTVGVHDLLSLLNFKKIPGVLNCKNSLIRFSSISCVRYC